MKLSFERATKLPEIKEVFEHTSGAFSDTPDFEWTLDDIKQEIKSGWEIYAVRHPEEIIAAAFIKNEGGEILLTKNTAIKMGSQGSGFSHQIKEFFEEKAREMKLQNLVHYCRIDNFRMYALNESHGYKKSDKNVDEDGLIVVWEKNLK